MLCMDAWFPFSSVVPLRTTITLGPMTFWLKAGGSHLPAVARHPPAHFLDETTRLTCPLTVRQRETPVWGRGSVPPHGPPAGITRLGERELAATRGPAVAPVAVGGFRLRGPHGPPGAQAPGGEVPTLPTMAQLVAQVARLGVADTDRSTSEPLANKRNIGGREGCSRERENLCWSTVCR